MTQRLYVQGYHVQPILVLADDEGEVCKGVRATAVVVEPGDLAAWETERWPADFAALKEQLLRPPPEETPADGEAEAAATNGHVPAATADAT